MTQRERKNDEFYSFSFCGPLSGPSLDGGEERLFTHYLLQQVYIFSPSARPFWKGGWFNYALSSLAFLLLNTLLRVSRKQKYTVQMRWG